MTAFTAARWAEEEHTLAAGQQGSFGQILRDTWHATVETAWADRRRTVGHLPLVRTMSDGVEAGVGQRLVNVVASQDIMIWDIDLLNPGEDPRHCPPRTSWLLFLKDGRVHRFRQFYETT